jgi:tRNA(His) guanylyltransferase
MINDNLGNRMKSFEDVFRQYLPIRMPVILRIDGKNFHGYTKSCKRPVDDNLVDVMNLTAIELCKEVQGCQLAYVQSDEISLLITNYQTHETQSWFHNNVQKMVSVAAGIASSTFTFNSWRIWMGGVMAPVGLESIKPAVFDARAFVLPKEEVCNYYLWRQKDSERNSVQMLARSLYSHKECNNKNNSELQEMIHQKGQNWNDLPTSQKRGRCIVKNTLIKPTPNPKTGETVMAERTEWIVNNNIPVFSKDRRFIDRYVYPNDQPKDADWHLEEDEMAF